MTSGLCHDLGHVGLTNDFLKEIQAPAAKRYPTSTNERLHFQNLEILLSASEKDILRELSELDRARLLDTVAECESARPLAPLLGVINGKKVYDCAAPIGSLLGKGLKSANKVGLSV